MDSVLPADRAASATTVDRARAIHADSAAEVVALARRGWCDVEAGLCDGLRELGDGVVWERYLPTGRP